MRSKLLLSTAALLAGVALASAQNMPGGGGQSGGAAAPSQSGAGQERQSPSPQGQRAQDRPGQMQQGQKEKQGQREQRGQKEQTTQGKDRDMDKAQPKRGQRDQKEQTTGRDQDMDRSQRGQRERDQTTGQTPREQRESGQAGQRDRDQTPAQRQEGQRDKQDRRDQDQARQGREGGGSVSLTSEQRTKIRQTVLSSGPRVSNVNFSLSVGTVVPTSVRVVAVPEVLVEIHPEWRGFLYFIVGDQIIIVDRNHRIVAVIEV
jgi:hypothetical protein